MFWGWPTLIVVLMVPGRLADSCLALAQLSILAVVAVVDQHGCGQHGVA